MLKRHSVNIALVVIILAIAGAGIVFLSARESSKEWRAVRDRVMLQLMPSANKEMIDVIWKPFVTDVDIGVVVDADKQYQFIEKAKLEEWNVTEDMLFEQALRNLDSVSRNIKVEVAHASEDDPSAKYVIVELDDGYAAARIVSEGVRSAIARELGDEYVAAIPSRDFLIFWHKEFPLFDAFARQVQKEFEEEQDYPLTPTILFVNDMGIQEMIRNDN